MSNVAKPDVPFYQWLHLVNKIAEHNQDRLGHIPFWWDCYRKNYSPKLAHEYNYSGMTVSVPSDNKNYNEQPFPGDNGPDLMMDLGMV